MDARMDILIKTEILGVLLTVFLAGSSATAETEPVPGPAPWVAIPNVAQPVPGVLTGGQPTRDQLEEAAAAGYKTVVNLRTLSEDGAWDETEFVTQLGMEFVHLPISGTQDINRENAAALRKILRDPEVQPVMVHCASGNRVGALFAVGASLFDGASLDGALELGRSAGLTRLETMTREYLSTEPN